MQNEIKKRRVFPNLTYRNFNVEIPRSLRSLGMTGGRKCHFERSEKSNLFQHLTRCIGISMFPYFAPQAQAQKSVKTAMDGSFRNFEKVSQDGLTCLIVGFLIMALVLTASPAIGANPKEELELEKGGVAFSAVHPLVHISTGFLLGGSNGGLWIPTKKTVPMMKDGENYQLYSARKLVGETKGKKTRSFGRQCEETYGVKFSSDPYLAGPVVVAAAVDWPLLPRAPKFTSTKQKVYIREAARLLENLGLQKPEVHLTSVIRVDLDGDGTEEVVASAAHEVSGKNVPSNLGSYNYSLIFLRRIVGSKVETVPLLSHVYKEDVEDNPGQKYYLSSIRIELLGIFDLNGDGRMELLVYDSYYEGDSVIVYEVDGLKANKVLAAGCGS